MTLNEYLDAVLDSYKLQFTDFQILEIENSTLSQKPAVKVIYTHNIVDDILKKLQIFTINDQKGYYIEYASPELEFDDYQYIVEKMINSLEILKMPPCNYVKESYDSLFEKCTL